MLPSIPAQPDSSRAKRPVCPSPSSFLLFFFPPLLFRHPGRLSNAYNGAENAVVAAERYPFIVLVTLNNKHILCGGFIDNPRFIVTAASCVCQKTTSQIQVTFNPLATVHEAYDNTTRFNDIAMLEMSQVMEFEPSVNYIPFTKVSGSLAIITGWGAFDILQAGNENDVYRATRSSYKFTASCDVFSTDVFDQNTMFCWRRSGFATVFPTSATTLYATGIVTKNLGCGDSQIFETIYTRLMVYNDWMLRVGGPQY
ncbi:hypothetical protein GHT06_016947 [Daphnia sinensis]|uniref:Peptidase S1 domain-containing protein n=1 Tax=Daphnia sinensis TaxID=1820382 RepID=A0AAD5L6N1_9CRUS|nr:hypothetical protein GHT06_016947 [Daphnia sinensis]